MLGQQANSQQVARNRLQHREALHQSQRSRGGRRSRLCFIVSNGGLNDQPMSQPLESLGEHGRQPATELYRPEACRPYRPDTQRRSNNSTGGHRILDSEVNSHATHG
jgi:hypothetical protein